MKRPGSFFSRLKGNEKGNVIIIVALLMMVLMGITALVIDVGYLYQTRRQMVTAADAGALAGVVELIESEDLNEAEVVARNYAIKNESEDGQTTVNVLNSYTVEVYTGKNVGYIFARILGFENQDVPAYAKAVYAPIIKGKIVPFTLHIDEFKKNEPVTIKFSHHYDGDIGPGNYHALALGSPGANTYRDNIKYTYDEEIEIGDWLDTEGGNMSGPTRQGIQYRFDQCSQNCNEGENDGMCIDHDCPRKVLIPVYDELKLKPNKEEPKPGNTEVQVAGFAKVFLLEVPGTGNESIIEAKFITFVTEEEVGEPGDTSIDFDVFNVKLID